MGNCFSFETDEPPQEDLVNHVYTSKLLHNVIGNETTEIS